MNLRLRQARPWVLALVLVGVCLYLAATISLTVEAAEDDTISTDVTVSTWVQDVSAPGLHTFVSFLNWVGKPIPLALLAGLVAVGLMAYRRYAEMILVLPTMFSHAVNYVLKNVTESPRPPADLVRVSDHASGFGFPSGHTMATVVFCGVMVYLAWLLIDHRQLRRGVQVLAGVAVAGIGFSRIYSGAHWPSDVLGGYLWGAFYTVVMILAFHYLRPLISRGQERTASTVS